MAPKHRIRFWPIDTIVTAHERRYLLADSAMEIFLKDRTTKLFNFPSTEGPHSSRQARSKVCFTPWTGASGQSAQGS